MGALWRRLWDGAFVLLRRKAADAELDAEVQHYFAEHVAELAAAGVPLEEARRRARLELGEPVVVREDVRSAGWEHGVGVLLADLRHAARRLRNNMGFAVTSVLTLALGIGASTAVFSAVNPILLEPLPYPQARRLVMVWDRSPDGTPLDVTFGTYRELLARSRVLENMAVMRPWQPTLTGVDEPQRLEGQRVSASYFRVLGIAPVLGRDFDAADDVVSGPGVVILSHRLWQRQFNGDEAAIGRTIVLNDRSYTIVGVMPHTFENVLAAAADVWTPLQYDVSLPIDGAEWGHHLRLVGRIRRDSDVDQVRRELDAIAAAPVSEFTRVPWAALSGGLSVQSLHADVTRGVRPALIAIAGAVLLLLVIASVNVTNLLLAQGARRRSELALRVALGAVRSRLVVQHIVEALLLAGIGAIAGMGVAYGGIRALIALSPQELPRVEAIRFDASVFLFALCVTTALGVLIGVGAALHSTRRGLHAGVQRQSARVVSTGTTTRHALVVVEVALAVVLLVSGGLLLRSLQRLLAVDAGFASANVLTMRLRASVARFDNPEAVQQYFDELLDTVRAVPGVTTAAFTTQLPLTGDYVKFGAFFDGATVDPNADGSALVYDVTPDYFDVLRIPLRSGRLLTDRDVRGDAAAVLINESYARRTFAGADPLGERIRLGGQRLGRQDQPWGYIVGVVGDVKHLSLASPDENTVYLSAAQSTPGNTRRLVVRTRTDAAALAPAIRHAIWSVHRDQPISDVATMAALVARSAAERRFILIIFEAFAVAALLLAAVGLYGLLAGGVHDRLREIGVRAALGATGAQIVTLVVRQALTLTGLGSLLGLLAALAVSRALASMLFGTSPTDVPTYAGVALLLLATSAVAASLPAWRALRVDPAITLRSP